MVSPFVLAELDHILMSRAGIHAELTLLKDLAHDVYQVAAFTRQDADRVEKLAAQHADLKLGIADAHTMILAASDRYGTTWIVTFDHKHFRAVKPLQGGVFTVLPADVQAGQRAAVTGGGIGGRCPWLSVRWVALQPAATYI